MSSPAPGSSGAVRPLAALAYATVGFVALVIAGFGMTSLLLDADVIAVPGLGAAPGALGVALATLSFAGVVWATVRTARPSYGGSALAAVAAFLGYLAGVWFGALLAGVDLARATADALSGSAPAASMYDRSWWAGAASSGETASRRAASASASPSLARPTTSSTFVVSSAGVVWSAGSPFRGSLMGVAPHAEARATAHRA